MAAFGPILWPVDPLALDVHTFVAPGIGHPMGTDDLGRDVLSRVIFGARVSLRIGLSSAAIATLVGTFVGALSGYWAGPADDLLMRITEIFQVIPRFLLAIVVVALFGSGEFKIILVIGLLSWPSTARIVRGQFLVVRSEEFVLSAVMSGAATHRIIIRHILPNLLHYIIVSAFLQTGSAILIESLLSFLGLGDPSRPSWGLLLQQSQLYLRSAWWMTTFPGLALAVTIFGLNLLGDGLSASHSTRAMRRS
jgi:peptide/nickel transport system permease protein